MDFEEENDGQMLLGEYGRRGDKIDPDLLCDLMEEFPEIPQRFLVRIAYYISNRATD